MRNEKWQKLIQKTNYLCSYIKKNKIMDITVRINIDSPTWRKLIREIEKHKKVAEIEYPLPEDLQNCSARSHSEIWDKVWDKLSNHYGVDVRKLRWETMSISSTKPDILNFFFVFVRWRICNSRYPGCTIEASYVCSLKYLM